MTDAPAYPGLDVTGPDRALLATMQGGILKSHACTHVALICLDLDLPSLTPQRLASVLQAVPVVSELQNIEQLRQDRSGHLFCAIYFDAGCLETIGGRSGLPRDLRFRHGMARSSRHVLNDPAPETWQHGLERINILVQLASDDAARVSAQEAQLVERVTQVFGGQARITVEHGKKLTNAARRSIEPFGFVDGVSQPLFFKSELDRLASRGRQAGDWDPSADPFSLVLVRDHYSPGSFGSFCVYRKIAQNVAAFSAAMTDLGAALGLTPDEAAELLMGRKKDGSPLGGAAQRLNGFTFADDPAGLVCPHFAHIRKANPRADDPEARHSRIARRGVTIDNVQGEQGLQFIAFQRSISQQFERLQAEWANSPFDVTRKSTVGLDPVSGRAARGNTHKLSIRRPDGQRVQWPVPEFSTLRGGAYLFAPSIPTLERWR